MAGGIIAKLPHSWNNFATSLKHKRQEFCVANLIGTLDVEEKARAKYTHTRVPEGGSSAHMVQKKNYQHNKSNFNKNKTGGKASLIERTSRRSLPTSRRILIRRRECAMFVVVTSIGPPAALIATRSADMRPAARPPTLSLTRR